MTGKLTGGSRSMESQSERRGRFSPTGAAAGSAWFSHHCDKADDEWSGPHKHIEDALAAIVEDCDWEWGQPIYVRRGRKMKKAEMEEWGVEFTWQCDGPSIVVHLPNAPHERRRGGEQNAD